MTVMPREKVLVVDDEPMIRELLREALQGWGYEVSEAGTAAQTLVALGDAQVAGVLLDINLPDSSGLDLLREIKRRQPGVAVIMVSGETFYDTAVSALRGGADDFIGKPIRLEELRFALNHAIEMVGQNVDQVEDRPAVSRPRVLIMSDSAERIPRLQSVLPPHGVEITSVVFPEEWGYAAAGKHDMVLIDVDPELLETLLRALRTSGGHAEIPVLVEKRRITEVSSIAGIMPKYRAMPCGHGEMMRLARRRLTTITSHKRAKGLL
jgi:DNA-binding response OmpR family regulator